MAGSQPACPKDWPELETPGSMPIYHAFRDTHIMKFTGAGSATTKNSQRYSMLRNSNKYIAIPPPCTSVRVCFGLAKSSAYWTIAYGAMFMTLARFKWVCNLLHGYPEDFTGGLFRKEGRTEEQLSKASFQMHSVACGSTKEEFVRATCIGPEPGYVATPKMLVSLALTMLRIVVNFLTRVMACYLVQHLGIVKKHMICLKKTGYFKSNSRSNILTSLTFFSKYLFLAFKIEFDEREHKASSNICWNSLIMQ